HSNDVLATGTTKLGWKRVVLHKCCTHERVRRFIRCVIAYRIILQVSRRIQWMYDRADGIGILLGGKLSLQRPLKHKTSFVDRRRVGNGYRRKLIGHRGGDQI